MTKSGGREKKPVKQSIFIESLYKEISDLKDDIQSIKYYPIVSLGLTYRF
jgi:hypothetical protein